MSDPSASLLFDSNPFATHWVRPGMLRYRFPTGWDAEQIMARLKRANWKGQIVGPHGTGKTTLLKTLDQFWHDHNRQPQLFVLRDRQRCMPSVEWSRVERATQLIVDGYEQLSLISRSYLRLRCQLRGCGLLVTTHKPVWWMPVVYQTTASQELVRDLAEQLAGRRGDGLIDAKHIDGCFRQANGNVRETFMMLYDVMESSRRRQTI